LKDHWMRSDTVDPDVVLRSGAWSSSHVLLKSFYDGKLSELVGCIDAKLQQAVSELMAISQAAIDRDGVSLDDLAKGSVEL